MPVDAQHPTHPVHPPEARSGEALRAGLLSLFAGAALLAAKTAAWLVTGSTVLLADAAESIVNVVAALMVTFSLIFAARPPDASHPYGHGKAQPLSAMVEGSLILLAALAISVESLRRLLIGPELERLTEGIAISAATGVANLLLGLYLLRVGRRAHSEALRADGVHLLTDTVTTAGGVAALIAVQLTGWPLLDPLVALVVAANILRAGWTVVRGALVGLLDEADPQLLERLAQRLQRARETQWCEVHQLRARSVGPRRHVDLHLVVPRYLSMDEAHRTGDRLERELLDALEGRGDVVVHLDPCRPQHCPGCAVEACPVRSHPLLRPRDFDIDALTREGTI